MDDLSRKRVAEAVAQQPWPKRPKLLTKTDATRWRLKDDDGCHTWHYMADDEAEKEWPQSDADRWYLGIPMNLPDLPKPDSAISSVRNGLDFFERLQLPPGNWGCEYGGPMFLLPGIVMCWYATKTKIPDEYATEMRNYLFAHLHPEDGGWGLHIEGESSAFGITMNYIALRLLGVEPDVPEMVRARSLLHKLGGATHSPHWAKFWLATLNIASWDLVNPAPPEIWLLPDCLPISPWRWWIHIRQVFLPMSFIYSRRWQCEENDLIRSLRNEVYAQPYETINWESHRNSIAPTDNYYPKTWVLKSVNWLIANVWNPYLRPNIIRDRAEAWVSELVDVEDANTDYAALAPVSAPMNTIVCYIRDGPGAYTVRRHLERLEDSIWVNKEGMLVNGTNGVQSWDTAFAIQAIVAAGLEKEERWKPMLLKALTFLDQQQIRDNCPDQEKYYRQQRKGGWPFSNRIQGYAVSDCVSECIKSVLLLQNSEGYPRLLDDQRIKDAVDTILVYQNSTGGCGSYEKRRGSKRLEILNAAEVFGNIMVEYDYPECTTACVTALSLFQKYYPDYRSKDIKRFVKHAVQWIKKDQRADGSWYGSWGICFTYAAMFATESLAHVGETYLTSADSKRACEFLLSKQREDGGWSESYKGSETMTWHDHENGSQVVQTAWALIALMEADYPHLEPLKKGVRFLIRRQQPNGEWLQENIEGVFNKSCTISYPNYKFVFPIKALGMFARRHPDVKI
ncbi:Lanosterol synthase (Oxidosqualene--lanosterol cyclase) [Ceratocystis pirilliformis]|uniref:Terpene cyclase/mutase family member n=1 Tax=Ceratocystis pirilliformis TaxID=259994 RepID=A0ABR3YRD3_9PEZI